MDGAVWQYEVEEVDILAPSDVEGMTAGEYELTLFTCTYGGQSRVTVRCVWTSEEPVSLRRNCVRVCEMKENKRPQIRPGFCVGKLTVIETTPERKSGDTVWRCQCDCGGQVDAPLNQLRSGYRKSCACLQRTQIVNNLRLVDGTSVTILEAMKSRVIASNTSGCNGVYRNKKNQKWAAQITFKGKTYYLGSYNNMEDAVKARKLGEETHDDFLQWYYCTHPEKNPPGSKLQKTIPPDVVLFSYIRGMSAMRLFRKLWSVPQGGRSGCLGAYSFSAPLVICRYRKVTTCPRVQALLGAKCVSSTPFVTPF